MRCGDRRPAAARCCCRRTTPDADVLRRARRAGAGRRRRPRTRAATAPSPAPLTDSRPDRDARRDRCWSAPRWRPTCRCSASAGACSCSRWPTAAGCTSTCPTCSATSKHRPAPGVTASHAARFAAGSRIAASIGDDGEVNSLPPPGRRRPGPLTVDRLGRGRRHRGGRGPGPAVRARRAVAPGRDAVTCASVSRRPGTVPTDVERMMHRMRRPLIGLTAYAQQVEVRAQRHVRRDVADGLRQRRAQPAAAGRC